ncbi:MAG: molybdopterin-dependent oxidoreductase [Eggerthellaceae bacterium]|nr:molybdopterin-dependent oxidoreductase [Eggerthellaceae bacterium]
MNDLELKMKGKVPGPDTGIEIRKSVCAICDPGTQCGLDLYVKDGKIVKVAGTKEAPHSHGTLCSKGAAMRQYVYSPDRIMTPLRRVGERGSGEFEPISWDEALDEIASRLNAIKEEFGPESVMFFSGYAKWARAYLMRFALDFGSPNYMTESSTCATAMVMAQQLTYGAPAAADLKNTSCIVYWSHNPSATKGLNLAGINKKIESGLKMIVVDPRVTDIAQRADVFLQIRPGTDGALALAFGNVIIEEGLYDKGFVENWSVGFEEYRQVTADMTPEKAAGICGVSAADIRAAARMYAEAKPACIHFSAAPVVHHTNGVQNYRAVFCLIALTGNLDIAGGNRMNPPSLVHMPGGFPTREREFTGAQRLSDMPERVGSKRFPVWARLCNEAQACDVPRQIRTGDPYPLKAFFALGLNYRMWPGSQDFIDALCELDVIVDADLILTDSAKYADIVLPACSSAERREIRCWPMGYVQFSQPAIEPVGESKSDVQILSELSKRLGLGDDLLEAGIEACVEWMLEPCGLTVEELNKHPEGMWVPDAKPPAERKYLNGGFRTPSGKVEFVSTLLAEVEGEGFEPVPSYREPVLSPASSPDLADEYPLVLGLGARLPMYQHSRTFRLPWTRSLSYDPHADVNPEDARQAGIEDGSWMRISTPHGEVTVRAHVTRLVRVGDVHMYHDWPQANANDLLSGDYLDPISGFPGYRSSLCKIEPVPAEGKEADND